MTIGIIAAGHPTDNRKTLTMQIKMSSTSYRHTHARANTTQRPRDIRNNKNKDKKSSYAMHEKQRYHFTVCFNEPFFFLFLVCGPIWLQWKMIAICNELFVFDTHLLHVGVWYFVAFLSHRKATIPECGECFFLHYEIPWTKNQNAQCFGWMDRSIFLLLSLFSLFLIAFCPSFGHFTKKKHEWSRWV